MLGSKTDSPKIDWGEPPAKKTRSASNKYTKYVDVLKDHKDQWGCILTVGSYSQASQAVSQLKNHDGVDACSRKLESGNVGVWACYDGLTTAERDEKSKSNGQE